MKLAIEKTSSSAQTKVQALKEVIKLDLTMLKPRRVVEEVALVLLVLQLFVLGFNSLQRSQPILGLRLEDHVIGQMLGGDFIHKAAAVIDGHENTPLTIRAAEKSSTVTLRQFGVNIDEARVYNQALKTGRTGNLMTQVTDQDLAAFGGRTITLKNTGFNNELAQAYITALDQRITIQPTNAFFAYEKENQRPAVQPDYPGRKIDNEAALDMLRRARPGQNQRLVLPIGETDAVVTADLLQPLLSEVRAIAQKPLTIVAGGSRLTLSPEQLVGLVVPKITSDPKDQTKTAAQITFDEAKLNATVDQVVKQAVVPSQPTIVRGGTVIQQGREGVQVADNHPQTHVLTALIQRQTGAAAPDEAHIPLVQVPPPVVHQAAVSSPRTRTGSGRVRLTFDDGPGAYTEQVLNILARYNVHATFYVVGRNVQGYPGTMQRIRNEGHSIGNHSFSHANLARLSRAGVVQELSSTQAAVQQTAGVTPTLFRPPYGALNGTVREVAASLGLSVELWSVDPRDWAQPGSSAITQRVLADTGPGSVVLLHVLYPQTVNALPSIIEGLRARGLVLE